MGVSFLPDPFCAFFFFIGERKEKTPFYLMVYTISRLLSAPLLNVFNF